VGFKLGNKVIIDDEVGIILVVEIIELVCGMVTTTTTSWLFSVLSSLYAVGDCRMPLNVQWERLSSNLKLALDSNADPFSRIDTMKKAAINTANMEKVADRFARSDIWHNERDGGWENADQGFFLVPITRCLYI